jgi:hypothetical protein
MSQVLHVVRKDLRRLRWVLGAWCAFVAARLAAEILGPDAALEGLGPQLAVEQLTWMLWIVDMLLTVLVVSRIVHDEPLVGHDAFWITRPLSPRSLLAAKLVLLAAFLVVLPVAAEALIMRAFHARLSGVAAAIPSLTRYVFALIGIVGAFAAASAFSLAIAMFVATDDTGESAARLPDPTGAVILMVTAAAGALAVVAYQYHRRRVGRALIVAAVALAASVIVPALWPWSLAPALAAPPPGAVPAGLSVAVDPTVPPRIDEAAWLRRSGEARRNVLAKVVIDGVPADMSVRHVSARSTLAFPDGGRLETNHEQAAAAFLMASAYGAAPRSVAGALTPARLLTPVDTANEYWPTLLRVDEDAIVRYGRRPGTLTAALEVFLERASPIGVLPLREGAAFELDRRRFEIVHVLRRATSTSVQLRVTCVEPLFSWPRYRQVAYVLRNTARQEAIASDAAPVTGPSWSFGSFSVHLRESGGRGFALEQWDAQFPQRVRPDMSPILLDPTWVDGAELVLVEATPAGSVTRAVTIEDFRIVR